MCFLESNNSNQHTVIIDMILVVPSVLTHCECLILIILTDNMKRGVILLGIPYSRTLFGFGSSSWQVFYLTGRVSFVHCSQSVRNEEQIVESIS